MKLEKTTVLCFEYSSRWWLCIDDYRNVYNLISDSNFDQWSIIMLYVCNHTHINLKKQLKINCIQFIKQYKIKIILL